MQARTEYIETAHLQGYRAVVMHTQNIWLVANDALKYRFWGFTPDRRYFVELEFSLSLPFLLENGFPSQPSTDNLAVPVPELLPHGGDELMAVMDEYNHAVGAIIEDTPDETFTPQLNWLDEIMLSFTYFPES